MYSSKTTGLRQVENLQRRLAKERPRVASVGASASPGRSAGDNVIILRYWAKHGRNVIFLTKTEEDQGRKLWQSAIREYMRGRLGSLDTAGHNVAKVQIKAIRTHVQEGRRERGRVKPLAESTIKRKERETGRKDLPALFRTGALMASLKPESRKV